MDRYSAEWALLPGGFAPDVLIDVHNGVITSVTEGRDASAAEHIRGVVLPGMADVHSHGFQRVFGV